MQFNPGSFTFTGYTPPPSTTTAPPTGGGLTVEPPPPTLITQEQVYASEIAKVNAYRTFVPKSMNFYPIVTGKEFMIQNVYRNLLLSFNASNNRFYWTTYPSYNLTINKNFLFTYDTSNKNLISVGKRETIQGQPKLPHRTSELIALVDCPPEEGCPELVLETPILANAFWKEFNFVREDNSLYLKQSTTEQFIQPNSSLQAVGSLSVKYVFEGQAWASNTVDSTRINIIYEGRGWKSAPHCSFKVEGEREGERGTTTMEPSDDLKVDDIISLRGSTEMAEFWPEATLNYINMENIYYKDNSNNEYNVKVSTMKTVPTKFKVVSVMRADGTPQYGDSIVRSYDRIVLERVGTTSKLTNDNGLLNEVQTGEPRWEIISQVSFRGQPIKYKDTVMLFFNGQSNQALTRNSNGQIHCTSDMYCSDPFYGIDDDALFDPDELRIEPRHDPNMEPFFELPVKEFYKRYPLNIECVRRNFYEGNGVERSAWYKIYAPPGYASLGDFVYDPNVIKSYVSGHASWDWSYWQTRSSKHFLSWPNTSLYRVLFVKHLDDYNPTVPTVEAIYESESDPIMDTNFMRCSRTEWLQDGMAIIRSPRNKAVKINNIDVTFISMGYFISNNSAHIVRANITQYYPVNLRVKATTRTYLINPYLIQNIYDLGGDRKEMINGGAPPNCDFGMRLTTYSSANPNSTIKWYHMFNGSTGKNNPNPLTYFIIFPNSKKFDCCEYKEEFRSEKECGSDAPANRVDKGYLGNANKTYDFPNKCNDLYFEYCEANNENDFKTDACHDFLGSRFQAGRNSTLASNELIKFCREIPNTTITDPIEKYPNVKNFPDLCSCFAPDEYLRKIKQNLINDKFSLIAGDQAKLRLLNLADDDPLIPCQLMKNCKPSLMVEVPGIEPKKPRSVIYPSGETVQKCDRNVCIQQAKVQINNSTLNNSPINIKQLIKGCDASYSTTCTNPVYGPVYTKPSEPLKYLRDPLPGNPDTDICFQETACEFEPSLTDSNKPLIVSDSCVNGTRTIIYKYKSDETDCKDAARDLTIKNFPGITQYLLPSEQQPGVNTTDKTIRVTSRCTDCRTNTSTSSTCMLDTTQKTWYKTITKTEPTQPTNGGAACTSANNPSSTAERIPCDENKDCVITQISDACTTTPGQGTRTTKFRIDSKPSGNGKTCKRVAEDTTSTSSYSNRKQVPEPVNDELTITSDCFNCTETFNNPACVYDTASKTWKVTKTSTITPSRFGGNTCTLVPRTLTEPCPTTTNKDCEFKTDVVDRCNTDSGVRTMKVDILKYPNGSGVSCEAKARQLMPEMTNINKVYDSYIGEGSCTAFKDCQLDESTYNDVCDEMKGGRSITIDVLNETVGTGKKSCETVAIEIVNEENPDIVIDEVSRDGNTVNITSTCSKRKFYMLIAIIFVVIVLIVGGVLLLI